MKKLRFEINGVNMEMGSESMSLQLKNPMFEDIGSHSLPIKIPKTPNNDSAIKGFLSGALPSACRYPAKLFFGARQFVGEFVQTKSTRYLSEGYFTTGIATFRDIVSNKMLTDIDYTEEIIGPVDGYFPTKLNEAAAGSYPTYNYTCFPLRTPEFYNPYTVEYQTMMNPWSYKQGDPSYQGFMINYVQRYAPSFYLCFVISKVFETYGYVIESNAFLDDAELKTLVVTNFNSGYMAIATRQYDLKFSDAMPHVPIGEFISGLERLFNVTFFINDGSKTVVIKKNGAIVKSASSKKLTLVDRELKQEDPIDGFSLNYTMDPDDSFSSVKTIEGLVIGITVDNKADLDAYLAGSYPNQLAFISNNDLYYISTRNDQEPTGWVWAEYTRDYFGYTEGAGDHEISTDVNTILTDDDVITDLYTEGGGTESAILPKTNVSCINEYGWQQFKSFNTLRLLFYRGIVPSGGVLSGIGSVGEPGTQECDYPLASPDVYRANQTVDHKFGRIKIPAANQALKWGGPYGLYLTHWKDYLYWFLNIRRAATDYYNLTLEELLGINFWEKYQAGDQSVLFRTINIDLDFERDSIRVGECEVYLS
ncbi:MAG: hypothetical protein V2B15_06505 [Bacteroidota bacterium]